MNRKKKLLILLSAILIMSLAVFGCSAEDKEEPNLEENSPVDEGVDNGEEDIEDTGEENSEVDENMDLTKLPEFNLKDLEGKDVSSDVFDDYEFTIVPVWQSTCGPCIGELDALNTIYAEYYDEGVNVLGISLDDVETMGDEGVQEVADTLGLEYTNVIADNDYLMELIDYVKGTPTAYIIGKDREILLGPIVGSGGKEKDIERFRATIEELMER